MADSGNQTIRQIAADGTVTTIGGATGGAGFVNGTGEATRFSTPSAKLFELKPLRNPMQHELVTEPFGHVDGWVHPPTDRPGLGIEVIDDVVDRYRQ